MKETRQIKIYVTSDEYRLISGAARQLGLKYPTEMVKAVIKTYLGSTGIQAIVNEGIERRKDEKERT